MGGWVLRCVFAAKLVVLLVPGVHVMPAAALVLLAGSAHTVIPTHAEAGEGARRLPAAAGWLMVRPTCSDDTVANRNARVWLGATETGP